MKNKTWISIRDFSALPIIILLYDLLKDVCKRYMYNYWGISAKFIGIILLIIITGFIGFLVLQKTREKARIKSIHQEEGQVKPHKGLIAIVSPVKENNVAEVAIKHHLDELEHCWLLVTEDSMDVYQDFVERFTKYRKGETITFEKVLINNPDDPGEVFEKVEAIYNGLKTKDLREKDVIADYTGGKKSQSAGMVLAAARSPERQLEYIWSGDRSKDKYGSFDRGKEAKSFPILVSINWLGN